MLKTLHHPHIVPYLDHFWDDSDQALYLVMAFCDCGDLLGLIERTQAKSDGSHKRAVRVSEAAVWRWTVQLLLALHYLHSKHVLHRDLKSQVNP